MIKIRDFADSVGCTPQNIYLHLETYKAELEGHVFQGPRGKVLDDYACDFIKGVMNPKELVADNELLDELNRARALIVQLDKEKADMAVELSKVQTIANELKQSLNDKERLLLTSQEEEKKTAAELTELQETYNQLTVDHDGLKGKYDELQESNNNLVSNYKELVEDLQEERTRKLTWKERFTGRKNG